MAARQIHFFFRFFGILNGAHQRNTDQTADNLDHIFIIDRHLLITALADQNKRKYLSVAIQRNGVLRVSFQSLAIYPYFAFAELIDHLRKGGKI